MTEVLIFIGAVGGVVISATLVVVVVVLVVKGLQWFRKWMVER